MDSSYLPLGRRFPDNPLIHGNLRGPQNIGQPAEASRRRRNGHRLPRFPRSVDVVEPTFVLVLRVGLLTTRRTRRCVSLTQRLVRLLPVAGTTSSGQLRNTTKPRCLDAHAAG